MLLILTYILSIGILALKSKHLSGLKKGAFIASLWTGFSSYYKQRQVKLILPKKRFWAFLLFSH